MSCYYFYNYYKLYANAVIIYKFMKYFALQNHNHQRIIFVNYIFLRKLRIIIIKRLLHSDPLIMKQKKLSTFIKLLLYYNIIYIFIISPLLGFYQIFKTI